MLIKSVHFSLEDSSEEQKLGFSLGSSLLISILHIMNNKLQCLWWVNKVKLKKTLLEKRGKQVLCVWKGDSGTWHGARDPEYSQMHINFQTKSHWTTVIQPHNGNRSANQEFCHSDLRTRWPTKSIDQGQERRREVCGKEIGGKLVSWSVSDCECVSKR